MRWWHLRLIVGLGLVRSVSAQEAVETDLRTHVIPVTAISFDATWDLEPLVASIGDARVVVLGESTHQNGSESFAKARMVRFLHERMGFDILAWETGVVQAYGMNHALRDPTLSLEDAASYLMAGGWAREEALQPLFAYARESWTTDRPLYMAGIDAGRPRRAAGYLGRRLDELFEKVPQLDPGANERGAIDSLLIRAFGFLSSDAPGEATLQRQRSVVAGLAARIRERPTSLRRALAEHEIRWFERALEHALWSDELQIVARPNWNLLRDSVMASNLLRLATEDYPDRKIIVWAATAHFIRNSDRLSNASDTTMYEVAYEAGNRVFGEMGEQMYTLAFTSYGGREGDVFPAGSGRESEMHDLQPAPRGCLEERLHRVGSPYGFLGLRGSDPEHWLGGSFCSVMLGRFENVGPWRDIIDGVFFIDAATPVRYTR